MDSMKLKLVVWRQASSDVAEKFEQYDLSNIDGDMSFLEMIDILNEQLILKAIDPVTLTMIVVKEFAVLVACISMENLMGHKRYDDMSTSYEAF